MSPHPPNASLSEQTYLILVSLASSPKHGYAIAKEVQALSHGRVRMSVSTLYTTLKRLLNDGWIRPSGQVEQQAPGKPRKTYELSGLGQGVLREEIHRLESLVRTAHALKAGQVS